MGEVGGRGERNVNTVYTQNFKISLVVEKNMMGWNMMTIVVPRQITSKLLPISEWEG